MPVFLFAGIIDSVILFFLGEMQIFESVLVFLYVAAFNSFGNFAPFYQIGTASLLDGITHRIRLLPFLMFYFVLNIWTITTGFFLAITDRVRNNQEAPNWDKTQRFGNNNHLNNYHCVTISLPVRFSQQMCQRE